jgi:glycosyltransferase involved in cell wall biosynthesis
MRRTRVLISAYACEPGRGSESEVGWRWVSAAARVAEVVVLLREQHLEGIRRYEAEHGALGVQWVPLRGPWSLPLGSGRGLAVQLHYLGWQRLALSAARELAAERPFDLVHHVTFVTFIYPSQLWRLDAPFIFGPVAGADRAPAGLRSSLGPRWRLAELGKRLRDAVASRLPAQRRCLRGAARVIAANPDNAAFLAERFGLRPLLRPALCVEPPAQPPAVPAPHGFRAVYAGALLGWKGLGLSLRAFRLFARQHAEARMEIIGSGPDEADFRAQVRRYRLEGQVAFLGHLPRAEFIAHLAGCDAMLFLSLRDSGGFVVVEALGQGCPVITRAGSGPGMQVRDGLDGVLCTAERPAALVREAAAALERLCRQPPDRARIHRDARRFGEAALADYLARLYAEVADGRG